MRFSANVSILFKEAPFLERFGQAAATGFSAVEFWWPSGEDPGAVEKAVEDADLRVALMNFDAGDMAVGDRGLAGDPEREEQFRGNLVANLREYVGLIGHVQIADSPGRGEPGTGEIHYPYVLAALEELGYDGYVGLEYNPTTGTTEESFGWLPEELRGRDVAVRDLNL